MKDSDMKLNGGSNKEVGNRVEQKLKSRLENSKQLGNK